MRGQIKMKKAVPIIFAIFMILFTTWPIPARAQTDYINYLSIRPGDIYFFTYSVNPAEPADQAHQSQLSVDFKIEINSIMDINNASCNITYTAAYQILVDGVPTNQVQVTTRTIANNTNSTQYVYTAANPWDLFFTNNVGITNRTVDVPLSANLTIGYGYITWDEYGVLSIAYFHTQIDGVGCLVTITKKTSNSAAVPGYSTALILVVAAIPTTLLACKIARKARRERIE
jgi:hypothetical protein